VSFLSSVFILAFAFGCSPASEGNSSEVAHATVDILPMLYTGKPLTTTPVVVKDDSKPLKQYPEVYIPGTEVLAENEMRIVALGTGVLAPTKEQGAASWMVELGNGEVFIFDAGAGSFANFVGLKIPMNKANKLFLTHLHLDHIGDIDVFFDVGSAMGRVETLHLYGPTGPEQGLGIEAYVEGLKQIAAWHIATKQCCLDPRSMVLEAHEFEPDQTRLVYDEDDVKIYAYPVVHAMHGAVGYRLEYRGLSFSFAGDSEASTQTVEHSKGVDVLVHEAFNPPELLMDEFGWAEIPAKTVSWTKHTPPRAAGNLFSMVEPKLAVTYHHFTREDTVQGIFEGVRKTYSGPLLIGQDLTVINVTPEQIVSRMAEIEKRPLPTVDKKYLAEKRPRPNLSLVKHDVPEWLQETVIKMDFIEEFKKQLAQKKQISK